MRVTFLGTGAAGGVPLYGCDCVACALARRQPSSARRPACALIETATTRVLLDAGLTDLNERFPAGTLKAIALTHFHPDHVQGLFHIRWGIGTPIPIWAPPDSEGCADLYRNPGLLAFNKAEAFSNFKVGDLKLTPLPLIHSKLTFGYAIEGAYGERFAYLTDTLGLPSDTLNWLKSWGDFSMALDCSFPPCKSPKNHNDWDAALALIDEIKPRRAWLTHISHRLDEWLQAKESDQSLGPGVANDGLSLTLERAVQC